MKQRLYKVVWVHEETETQGEGKPISKTEAEAWAREMNRKFPYLKHTAVPVTQKEGNKQ